MSVGHKRRNVFKQSFFSLLSFFQYTITKTSHSLTLLLAHYISSIPPEKCYQNAYTCTFYTLLSQMLTNTVLRGQGFMMYAKPKKKYTKLDRQQHCTQARNA